MLDHLVNNKYHGRELTQADYYEAVDYVLKKGVDKMSTKFFLGLHLFGMTKKEVLALSLAMRDSGKVLRYNKCILEKHSTGGVGDSSSMVLIPLLASLGYKIIKTTARSFVFTNGTADRFGAIPKFSTILSDEKIEKTLESTNACILSHAGDMVPADKILFDLREEQGMAADINLMAASIASKKLASGAKVVLVDVKYGPASLIKKYSQAKRMAKILRYVFKQCDVRCVITISNTVQTFGYGIGNALEVLDAINVLQGEKNVLRDVSIKFATEMILKANPTLTRKDVVDMIKNALDNGFAYERFLEIVKAQGGDTKAVKDLSFFKPYHFANFVSDRDGYVGFIDSQTLGQLVAEICKQSHDSNIGVTLRVKIGDYVKTGENIITFYYKDEEDLAKYKEAICGCVRLTKNKIKPVEVIQKVIR